MHVVFHRAGQLYRQLFVKPQSLSDLKSTFMIKKNMEKAHFYSSDPQIY